MDVIIHNSISVDGSITQFTPQMGLHYRIAGTYHPDAHLIGSNTIKRGIELYGEGIPPEEDTDFQQPNRDPDLPYWVIPDTRGTLKGMLHTCRRFEFCRAVIVLLSERTPTEYIDYLTERNYDHHTVGTDRVDLPASLELLSTQYQVKTLLADTGRILGNLLLEHGVVSEISLLIHPTIVGTNAYNLFGNIRKSVSLQLHKQDVLENEYVWLVYKVVSPPLFSN